MRQRMKRELIAILIVILGGISPALGGLILSGYLYTKGWPEGFCVPFGVVALGASVFCAYVLVSFFADSIAAREWLAEPEPPPKIKEPKKERLPRYGVWKDESDAERN